MTKKNHISHKKQKYDPYWHLNIPKNKRILLAILTFAIIVSLGAYFFWPFHLILDVKNTNNESIVSLIQIERNGEVIFYGDRNYMDIRLPKGLYNITINGEGYNEQEIIVDRRYGVRFNTNYNLDVELQPKYIEMAKFKFLDPTGTLDLGPKLIVQGTNILGNVVDGQLFVNESIMYGDYVMFADTNYFDGEMQLVGDRIYYNEDFVDEIYLKPDSEIYNFVNEEELGWVINYLQDYMKYSQEGYLSNEDQGLPRQFYLYSQDKILSLGDILFLVCEQGMYESTGKSADYFYPKSQNYWFVESVDEIGECYEKLLIGSVPKKVGDISYEDILYSHFYGENLDFKYSSLDMKDNDLNYKRRGPQIAFTYDIESGKYLYEESEFAVSPCEGESWSIGLSDHELICDKPEYVAWMSPRTGDVKKDEYDYPQVSGIIGYEQILDYSEKYGLPMTGYYVKKDVVAFNEINSSLIERSRDLIEKGLLEIGSHTRYHTNLGMVEEYKAIQEMKESRKWLAEYFNYDVIGFRGPYHSKLRDETMHARALENAGYEYFTQYGDYNGAVPGTNVIHKQWNGGWKYISEMDPSEMRDMIYSYSYVITLDHPWNMCYEDSAGYSGSGYLVENLELLKVHRANVLTAVNNGGMFVLGRDIEV